MFTHFTILYTSTKRIRMGNWLVVWLPFFIFPYIGNNHPNWLSYFSEGWPNHQAGKQVVTFEWFRWQTEELPEVKVVTVGGPIPGAEHGAKPAKGFCRSKGRNMAGLEWDFMGFMGFMGILWDFMGILWVFYGYFMGFYGYFIGISWDFMVFYDPLWWW